MSIEALISRDVRLRRNVEPSWQRGIEIGALNNPMVRPEEGAIEFVDYGPTEVLKIQHAAMPERVAGMVNVNYVWTGSGSLADVIGGREQYDYAIASHVIEHVPNFMGWFRGIFETLKPSGVFNLAVPDRRYTFDINRRESTLGEVVEADLMNYRIPSVRQMFDHCVSAVAIEPGAIWNTAVDPESLPPFCGDHAVPFAYDQALQIINEGRYVDSHCWIFTPISFCNLIKGATTLGIFPFLVEEVTSTEPGAFEFFVHLRKPVAEVVTAEAKALQLAAVDAILDRLMTQQRTLRLASV